jgi:hypothetical protein
MSLLVQLPAALLPVKPILADLWWCCPGLWAACCLLVLQSVLYFLALLTLA